MLRFDLRKHPYRKNKDYWRGRREGRIPDPPYLKPRVAIVKLDPSQAILASCQQNGAFMDVARSVCYTVGATFPCPGGAVRGVHQSVNSITYSPAGAPS